MDVGPASGVATTRSTQGSVLRPRRTRIHRTDFCEPLMFDDPWAASYRSRCVAHRREGSQLRTPDDSRDELVTEFLQAALTFTPDSQRVRRSTRVVHTRVWTWARVAELVDARACEARDLKRSSGFEFRSEYRASHRLIAEPVSTRLKIPFRVTSSQMAVGSQPYRARPHCCQQPHPNDRPA